MNCYPKYYLSLLFFMALVNAINAQTIMLPEQCDCDTSFVLNDTSLVIGQDTLALNHSIYTGNGTTPANLNIQLTDKIFFDTNTLVLDGVENKVGIGVDSPNPSAILDIQSTSKGLLPPRMSTAQRDAISNPATGLLLYNLDLSCLQVNDGTQATPVWNCMSGAN